MKICTVNNIKLSDYTPKDLVQTPFCPDEKVYLIISNVYCSPKNYEATYKYLKRITELKNTKLGKLIYK